MEMKGFDIVFLIIQQDNGSSTCVDKVHGAGVHEREAFENTANIMKLASK